MKKIFKSTLAVVAIAAVGMGSYKVYDSYVAANMSEEDLLLVENVEAISQLIESGSNYYFKKTNIGDCFARKETFHQCPGGDDDHMDVYIVSYDKVDEHYKCERISYLPAPWKTKPSDQCYADKKCGNGSLTADKVPSNFKGGKTEECYKDHK